MDNVERSANLDANIAALEEVLSGKKVETPTQSAEGNNLESSNVNPDVTAGQGQESLNQEAVKDLGYWKDRCMVSEQRFNVSKPKYDSNIYNLKQELIKLQSQVVELSRSNNQLQQTLAKAQASSTEDMFDQETVDVLGENVAGKMRKTFEETQARVDAQEQKARDKEIEDNERKLQNDVKKVYEEFIGDLNRLVPDQGAMNKDPNFIQYLKGVDETTGNIRMNLLRRAERARDAGSVAAFFKQYKAQSAPADSVNKRIAPSNNGSDAVENIGVNPGQMTMVEVRQFYADVSDGKFEGRRSEQLATEAKIDKAFLSNNII